MKGIWVATGISATVMAAAALSGCSSGGTGGAGSPAGNGPAASKIYNVETGNVTPLITSKTLTVGPMDIDGVPHR